MRLVVRHRPVTRHDDPAPHGLPLGGDPERLPRLSEGQGGERVLGRLQPLLDRHQVSNGRRLLLHLVFQQVGTQLHVALLDCAIDVGFNAAGGFDNMRVTAVELDPPASAAQKEVLGVLR